MENQSFTTAIVVDQSPAEVFAAAMNPRAWWSEEIEGGTTQLNDEFLYHYKDVHIAKIKLTELVPDKKLVWHVLENYFNFIQDQGNGKVQTSSSKFRKRRAVRNFTSHISDWCRNMNATRSATMRGPIISKTACAA